MRRSSTILLASVALAVLGLTATATSAFLLENLPEKPGRTFTGKSSGSLLIETVGGTAFECTSAPSTGTEATSKPPTGTYHISLMGCASSKPVKGLKCTGTGDSTGTILALGTWNLVFDKNPSTTQLVTAMLFLSAPVKLECGSGAVVMEIKGSLLCLHKNPTVSTRTHEYNCKQTNGVQEETRWWNSTGTEAAAQLLVSENGAAFEQMGLGESGLIETTEAIAADQ